MSELKKFVNLIRIDRFYLSAYSPNLNPIEFCWQGAKPSLRQFYPETEEELKLKGEQITQGFLENPATGYSRKWQQNFLSAIGRLMIQICTLSRKSKSLKS